MRCELKCVNLHSHLTFSEARKRDGMNVTIKLFMISYKFPIFRLYAQLRMEKDSNIEFLRFNLQCPNGGLSQQNLQRK